MNKGRFLLLAMLLTCLGANAQRQNLYFFKKTGQQVKLRDSADYLRIVKEPEPGSELYVVNEHYLDGTNKSRGFSSKINPPMYAAISIDYNFADGTPAYTVYSYPEKFITNANNVQVSQKVLISNTSNEIIIYTQ